MENWTFDEQKMEFQFNGTSKQIVTCKDMPGYPYSFFKKCGTTPAIKISIYFMMDSDFKFVDHMMHVQCMRWDETISVMVKFDYLAKVRWEDSSVTLYYEGYADGVKYHIGMLCDKAYYKDNLDKLSKATTNKEIVKASATNRKKKKRKWIPYGDIYDESQ